MLLTALILSGMSGCERPAVPDNLKPIDEPADSEKHGSDTRGSDQDSGGSGTKNGDNGSGTR
jgi:hypothetical protein